MRFSTATALTLALYVLPAARAQVTEFRNINGKMVSCTSSGLWSTVNDCGKTDWFYSYIFIGAITSITPTTGDEAEVQIAPEEVFLGQPPNPFPVLTSQVLCMPKIAIGDRWLFYFYKDKDKPVLFGYGGASSPVADAAERIATLHRLQKIGNLALLRGEVIKGEPGPLGESTPLPSALVTAKLETSDKTFTASTGSNGRFEFDPLPPGAYKITVSVSGSYQPDDDATTLKPGTCTDLTLGRSPHAEISGHVRHFDGSPAKKIDVVLVNADNTRYEMDQTDEEGLFNFRSEQPGEFVVGLIYPARPDWTDGGAGGIGITLPPISIYYPGVQARTNTKVINLKADEKQTSVDFIIPNTPPNVR